MKRARTDTEKYQPGYVKDARGESVRVMDPVRLHLLQQASIIPAETLRSMTDKLLPGARRQRLVQIITMVASLLLVGGGYVVWFNFYSSWKGFDPVNMTIMLLQAGLILGGPVLAFRMARARYRSQISAVMLAHKYCPHCGYDLRNLPVDAADETTTCPECGCAWRLEEPTQAAGTDDHGSD